MASIRKRGKHSWQVRVRVKDPETGEYDERAFTVRGTCKDAERAAMEAELGKHQGTLPTAGKLTVREYLDRWLEAARPGLSPRTFEGYENNVRRHMVPHIGNVPLAKLQPLAVQQLYTRLLDGGLSPKSVLYVHTTLHRALEMAVKWGLVPRNVCDAVDPPKRPRREPPVLDGRQAAAMLEAIDDLRLKVPVALALMCGLRRGEVCGLRWSDVDLGGGTLHVVQSVQRVPGEGIVTLPTKTPRSRRAVDMPEAVCDLLRRWRKQQAEEKLAAGPAWQEGGFVCTRWDGRPLDPQWISKGFRKVADSLGLPKVPFHGLRHTHATLLLQANVHPKKVQERLGHSTVGITLDLYSHVLPGMQKEAAQAMDRLFGGRAR